MRVLLFSERLAPPPDEGIKKLALELADGCRAAGHEVMTVTTGTSGWPERRVRHVAADRLLRSNELRVLAREFCPNAVIYVPTASLTLASGVRARALKAHAGGAPVALVATQGRRHRTGVRLAARLAAPDLCVAQSAGTLEQARAMGWRACILPPCVDIETFCPANSDERRALRLRHGIPAEAFVALHVGHLNRGRGVALLLAIADVAYPLLLTSTSTASDAALAQELRGAGVHLITDYLPDVADLYRLADLYLFPVPPAVAGSGSIDMPLSVLEAAACDLPVATTRFGALPEIWPAAPGIHFFDGPGGLSELVTELRAREAKSPGTRALVASYTWANAARFLLEALL